MNDDNQALIEELRNINNNLSKIANSLDSIATGIGNRELGKTMSLTRSLSRISESVYSSSEPRLRDLSRLLQTLIKTLQKP